MPEARINGKEWREIGVSKKRVERGYNVYSKSSLYNEIGLVIQNLNI